MQNVVNPEPGQQEDAVDIKSVKKGFMDLIMTASKHNRRLGKLSEIVRDKKIGEELLNRIEQSDEPLIKSSLLFKLFRTFEIQSELLPSTKARKEGASTAELSLIDSVKDLIYEDGDFDETYLRVNNSGYRYEGVTFVEIGYNQSNDFIALRKHEYANVFTDYDKDGMSIDQSNEDANGARWAAVRVGMDLGQVLQMYPDLKGKIQKGDFVTSERSGALNSDTGGNMSTNLQDKIYLYFCWSIITEEPQMIVFVGGNAAVAEFHTGKDYPHWVQRANRKKYAFVPLIDFHFTKVGKGLSTMSQVGMMADIAGADEKISNVSLPGIKKSVNKIVAVFGGSEMEASGADARVRDEMMLAQERQSLGINPVIPMPADARIETISPDSGIINEYAAARNQIYEIASDRFDIDFQRLSNDDVKATVFVGKTKTEIQAISNLYKINRGAFNRIAEYSIGLASNNWKLSDVRDIKVILDESTEDTVKLNASVAIKSMKKWTGRFDTDVDLKIPLTTSDRSDVIVELEAQKQNIFYSKQFFSVSEIKDEIAALVERARISGLDDLYKMADMIRKAEIMIENFQAQQQQMQPTDVLGGGEGAGSSLDTVNKDVAQELSPNTALAEAKV